MKTNGLVNSLPYIQQKPAPAQTKPTVTTQPQAKPTVTTQPQAKPTITTQPQAKPTITTQPQAKPTVTTQPQAKPVSRFSADTADFRRPSGVKMDLEGFVRQGSGGQQPKLASVSVKQLLRSGMQQLHREFENTSTQGSGSAKKSTGSSAAKMDPIVEEAYHDIFSPAQLVVALQSLTPDERNQLIAELMRDPEKKNLLLASSSYSQEGMRIVASAIGDAFRAGAITTEDLLAVTQTQATLAGGPIQTPFAAPRFMALLASDPANGGIGGPLDVLGTAYNELAAQTTGPEQQYYQLATAMAFTSSRELAAAHPELAAQNFSIMMQSLNDGTLNAIASPNGELLSALHGQFVQGATRVFEAHGSTLANTFLSDAASSQPELMMEFFRQACFSPNSASLTLENGQTLSQVILESLGPIRQHLETQMMTADEDDRQALGRQMGRLVGALVAGGEAAALEYKDQLAQNEEMLNTLSSAIATGLLVLLPESTPVGAKVAANVLTDKILKGLLGLISGEPFAPNTGGLIEAYNLQREQMRAFENANSFSGVTDAFITGYLEVLQNSEVARSLQVP